MMKPAGGYLGGIVTMCLFVVNGWMDSAAPAEEPRWAAPPLERAVSVRDGISGEPVAWRDMLDELADAEVVFLGESHTDETTHRVEQAVYEALLARRNNRVVLAMEMFERDVQTHLDDYVAGRSTEAEFLARSRPWSNYHTAYRPLVERAKEVGGVVIASNFPSSLRMHFSAHQDEAPKMLSAEQVPWVPRLFHPNSDLYWRRVDNATRSHRAMMPVPEDNDARLFSTQSLWDNSMGEACAECLLCRREHDAGAERPGRGTRKRIDAALAARPGRTASQLVRAGDCRRVFTRPARG